jgi:hypothetical protein
MASANIPLYSLRPYCSGGVQDTHCQNSTIALAASKKFLGGYLFHSGPGSKKMLWSKALEDVLDKFEILSSPNVQNMISSLRSNGKVGGSIIAS